MPITSTLKNKPVEITAQMSFTNDSAYSRYLSVR